MPTPGFDINELKRRMQGATASLKHELGGLRTGRAAASMLEPVQVEAYGTHMPLNQVATVSVPEPRLLSVQVWDKSMVKAVEKAIVDSNLGLSPRPKGRCCACGFPNSTRNAARNWSRSRTNTPKPPRSRSAMSAATGSMSIKKLEKNHEISEDDQERLGQRRAEGDRRHDCRDRPVAGGEGKGNPHRLTAMSAN